MRGSIALLCIFVASAILGGCAPSGSSYEEGYTAGGETYKHGSVTYEPFKNPPRQRDASAPLQPLPPDVANTMRPNP